MAEDRARPAALSLQVQVMSIILIIAGKVLLDGSLDREIACERERDAALARMVSELPPLAAPPRP